MTIPLESVDHDLFAPLAGQMFVTTHHGADVALELAAVRALGHQRPGATRAPFALTFRGASGLRLPQGIYPFHCAALGAISFFITQTGDGPQGAEFEAVFT